MSAEHPSTDLPTSSRWSWRVVDLVVAAVLAVATGVVFWAWDNSYNIIAGPLGALTPGLGGLLGGVWMIGGVLGGLVIRKPGAALLVEFIAAMVEAILGSSFGITNLYSGLVQGLGAEVVFLLFAYRVYRLPVAALAGMSAAVLEYILEWFTWGLAAYSPSYKLIYLAAVVASGGIIAGVGGWLLVRALARSGALAQFAAGREARRLV